MRSRGSCWCAVHDDAETWFDQFGVVAQFVQPVDVIAGRFGRLWVLEPDHIACFCGALPCHLRVMSCRRVQQRCSDMGVGRLRGKVSSEAVAMMTLVVLIIKRGALSADSHAVLVLSSSLMFNSGPGLGALAATVAHDLAGGVEERPWICARGACTSSWSFSFWA